MKGRKWTNEEDRLLGESVLHAIRSGGTQLEAFAEVGKRLNRTAGACGFRWNAVLRHQDTTSYSEAKRKRVVQKLQQKKQGQSESFAHIRATLRQVEQVWRHLKDEIRELTIKLNEQRCQFEQVWQENKRLKDEKHSYDLYQHEVKGKYQDLLNTLKNLRETTDEDTKYPSSAGDEVRADSERNSST